MKVIQLQETIVKRLHLHLSVPDLEQGIKFYSTIFASKPSKVKSDYAKWQLDDPRVNFAISTRSDAIGLDHLGIQAETDTDVIDAQQRLKAANFPTSEINNGVCCYSESNKFWAVDPAGIPWESFVTMNDAEVYGVDNQSQDSACCNAASSANSANCC
jgi:hypothetical protein